MSGLPIPLTPASCDLQDFSSLPLDVRWIRDTVDLTVLDAEDFKLFMLSWCVAWHQVPAASLPNDDAELAALLGYDVTTWATVRARGVLTDWTLCSDGRLYHPKLSDMANIAWPTLLRIRARRIRRLEMASGAWADIRRKVFIRDGFRCTYCLSVGKRLECDHIVPISAGGKSTMMNLTTACKPCNRRKGAKSLAQWVRA